MSAPLSESELAELSLGTIDEALLMEHMGRRTEGFDSRKVLQKACDEFVETFLLSDDEWLSTLHKSLTSCDTVLHEVEVILERFVEQLDSIHNGIGDIRQVLMRIVVELSNTQATEQVIWKVLSKLVVPPEIVHVVSLSNKEQLGTQFQLCTEELRKYLTFRAKAWRRSLHASVEVPPSTIEAGTPWRPLWVDHEASREVQVSPTDCCVYFEQMPILDGVTLCACIKMKHFLSRQLQVLTSTNTNICIQQESALKQYSGYVRFLRSAPPLLRHTHCRGKEGEQQAQLIPYRIARALYMEFRSEYCTLLSNLYLRKVQHYVFLCNALEHRMVPTGALSGGAGKWVHPAGDDYALPLLTDAINDASFEAFRLGNRHAILDDVFATPLVPSVEKVSHRRHGYEETFRSVLSITCDIITHEYLFTLQFFSGDASVYVDVFTPTVQFVVDYLTEVVLMQSNGAVRRMLQERPEKNLNAQVQHDCYGLLILIRLCHAYRALMLNERKLSCADGFLNSLLLLLWPAFTKSFERQLVCLRCVSPQSQLGCIAHFRKLEDKLSCVHPLVKCFAEFSTTVLGIALEILVKLDSSDAEVMGADMSECTDHAPSTPAQERREPGGVASQATSCSSVSDWRRRALLLLKQEEEERDTTDSATRLEVLLGQLSGMRLAVCHLLEDMGRHMVTHEPNQRLRQEMEPLSTCFLLNNVYYMLQLFHERRPFGGEDGGIPLENSTDYAELKNLQESRREQFVCGVICMKFPMLKELLFHDTDQLGSLEPVLQVAESFCERWRDGLNEMRDAIHCLLSDPTNQQEVLALACMKVLQSNTQLRGVVAERVEAHKAPLALPRPLRTILVPNQQLLHHMHSFSKVTNDDTHF